MFKENSTCLVAMKTQSQKVCHWSSLQQGQGPEVIKFEFILKLKIKHGDWLLVDTCPQAANHWALL